MSVQFNFGEALELLRLGKSVRRVVWDGTDRTPINLTDIRSGKRIVTALDILACDWMVAEKPAIGVTGDVTLTTLGTLTKVFPGTAFKATVSTTEHLTIELVGHSFSLEFPPKSFRALRDLLNAPWKG